MFVDWESVRVFVRPGATDLRKQINGLAVMAQTVMGGDPLSGHLYLFSNQERRLLKALYWDRTGSVCGRNAWSGTSSRGREQRKPLVRSAWSSCACC